jgi:hypothetical protein
MTVQLFGAALMEFAGVAMIGAGLIGSTQRSRSRVSRRSATASKSAIPIMALAVALGLGIDSAHAGIVQAQLPTTPAYTISYSNANLAPAPAIGYDKSTNTFVETATLTSNSPFLIKFQENAPADKSSIGAFKINVSLNLTNGTNQSWSGFKLSLMDADTSSGLVPYENFDPKAVEHPNEAHFHPKPTKGNPDFSNFMSNPFTKPAAFLTQTSFVAQGGALVDKNQAWTASGFFIHEVDIQNLARTFYLVETPIVAAAKPGGSPEPSTIVMAGTGAFVGLAFGCCRRARQRRVRPIH